MLLVGLTGGMGAGKSSVAAALADRGAHVVDADVIAREVVEPGEPALAAIEARFGDDVIDGDGRLDRAALAAIVFAADDERRALEEITHPVIGDEVERRLDAHRAAERREGRPRIVVLDHPLLVERGLDEQVDVLVVVTAPERVRVERLATGRGVDPDDARARMAAQASDDERRAVADEVVDNGGSPAALDAAVDALWARLTSTVEADRSMPRRR